MFAHFLQFSPLESHGNTVELPCTTTSRQPAGGGGGALPYKRLMGMGHWMGSHFHDWIDYNGVAFSMELLEWGHFRIFGVRKFYHVRSQNGLG